MAQKQHARLVVALTIKRSGFFDSAARQGVVFLDHFAEAVGGDMRINLGGGDIGVAQHRLHAAQIGAVLDKVCRKSMPQNVGTQTFGIESCGHTDFFQHLK
jgi:hypothetical protein